MEQKPYVVDIGPMTSALRTWLCDDSSAELSAMDAQALARNIREVFDFIQAHPSARGQILQEIGLQALGFLSQRTAAQFFASRAINKASSE